MPTYEVNDDLFPFKTTVLVRNRWGSNWYTSSGVLVGNNDILTAAHPNYNEEMGGWSDECRVYPSWDPDSSNYSTNYYVITSRRGYTDWDANGDGLIHRGDNQYGSLYELEKDICLISLDEDIGSIYGWMGLKFDFNGGNASKLGYPGAYDTNLMYDEGYVYKDSIDNYFWYYKSDIEVNAGDSGGPIYVNSGGDIGYQVIGIHASSGDTQGNAVALNAFANSWISEEIISNNYLYDKSFASITSEKSVDEGSSISFTFKTHRSEEEKQYTYTFSGISSLDIASNELTGKTTINSDGEATFTIGISSDNLTEGTEILTLSIGEKTKSVSINDTSKKPNEAPTDINLSSISFNENIAATSTVATLSSTDQDPSDTHTYSLVSGAGDTDNNSFTIDDSSLKIKASPDYETKSSYSIRLLTTDSSGETHAKAFTLSVTNLNDFTATILGTTDNDSLESTSSNDFIDGGEGTDIVSVTGSFSNYSFTRSTSTLQIADQRTTGTTDGTDTLKNIEYILFSDQTVEESKVDVSKTYAGNFRDYKFYNKGNGVYEIQNSSTGTTDDITGLPLLTFTGEATTSSFRDVSGIADIQGVFDQVTGLNTDSGEMFRLYNAAFARFPDADGLEYWIEEFSSGRNTRRVVAESFLLSEEFGERHGTNVSNAQYVETLYINILGREYDQEGYNYWLGNLNSGLETRYELLLGFAENAENLALFTEMTGLS